jgi:hypothetical protein
MKLSKLLCNSIAIPLLVFGIAAQAGRPLAVDDAGVNDVGAGHVEFWYGRLPQNINIWTVSPAYSPFKGFEVSATLSRDHTNDLTAKAIQGKLQLTPSNPDGCNFAVSFGTGYTNETSVNAPFLNGIGTCNTKEGSVHVNIGSSRPEGQESQSVWGIAFERDLGGVIGHIERFGQESMRPATQVGLRKEVIPGLQLDGTIGRYDGDTIYSVGMKKMF